MLIVLFIIFLLMIIIGVLLASWADEKYYEGTEFFALCGVVVGCIAEFMIVIAIIFNCYNISQLQVSDKKIEMYEKENSNIQNSISEIVENYKNYEQNTYSESLKNIDISNTDVVVLTQLYPDLKSNEMVNTQIQIYQDNNNKIKQIKEEKLNYQVSKWWLYFGKVEETE